MIKSNWISDIKRNIAISFITVIFLLHPTLADNSLSVFQWVSIDDNMAKVRIYTDMDWYSGEHLMWWFMIGFPILVIWVITIPILGLILLAKNIKKDNTNKVKEYMMILYQGLKPERFYWEFINWLRKVLILMSFTLFSMLPFTYSLMVAIIILVLTFRIQIFLKPYKNDKNNNAEILAILAGTLTISLGLLYTSGEDQQKFLNFILLLFTIMFNITFILRWSYLLIACMSDKYKFFKRILTIIDLMTCK